jgi:hypothetical protein
MEPEEELHSFPYSETIDGVEHNYRITQNDNKYGIEKDGIVIAEVEHGENWKQLSGEPLFKELLNSICDQIEAHND